LSPFFSFKQGAANSIISTEFLQQLEMNYGWRIGEAGNWVDWAHFFFDNIL
jgi:hypothetical protein